jgi:hypothetical protein
MNKLENLLKLASIVYEDNQITNEETFFEIDKVYAIRTVTMIYTGRVKKVTSTEILLDEAAWIPETERWADFVDTGAHKEAEPYKRPVVLKQGAILDYTEILSVIRKQK